MKKNRLRTLIVGILVVAVAAIGWGVWHTQGAVASAATSEAKVVTPDTPQAQYRVEHGVKVFHLVAEPVKQEVSKGVFMNAWGYNGSTPGPTIVVHEGDRVKIVVSNHLKVPTSVHWHGLIVPNNMDGVPGLEPGPAIQPGKSYAYEFTVKQVGTFMYHSHVQPSTQEMMGLDGMFISLPKNGGKIDGQTVNRDYTILLQEWQLQKPGSMGGMSMPAYGEGQVPAGTYDVNPEGMNWNIFTFNGKQFPATTPMEVKKGERVLVRIGNLSMQSHPLHLHGHNFLVVAKDGNPLPKSAQYLANTINVGVGETYDIEFTANNPGTWVFHCHLPHHTSGLNGQEGGMLTVFHYQGTPWPPFFNQDGQPKTSSSSNSSEGNTEASSSMNNSMGGMKMASTTMNGT
ncbi:multicopper oxidase family protein [Ferroacidibacillus organovorans]|uniref:multicopper oxidase family protein n=1 Tax=Ferroacidibacillus organovorans TaxID=1765683 RepID=UPI000AEAC87D